MEVVEASTEDLIAALDDECRKTLGLSAQDFLELVRHGEEPDDPTAIRLAVLAQAIIGRE